MSNPMTDDHPSDELERLRGYLVVLLAKGIASEAQPHPEVYATAAEKVLAFERVVTEHAQATGEKA